MPNPNLSELRMIAKYGEDGGNQDDAQNTNIYSAVSEDSDEIDHKFVYDVYLGGKYVELSHYASIKQIVIQNISGFWGVVAYLDNTTGAIVPDYVPPGEHISINDPSIVGLMLYARFVLEAAEWHLAICGRKD